MVCVLPGSCFIIGPICPIRTVTPWQFPLLNPGHNSTVTPQLTIANVKQWEGNESTKGITGRSCYENKTRLSFDLWLPPSGHKAVLLNAIGCHRKGTSSRYKCYICRIRMLSVDSQVAWFPQICSTQQCLKMRRGYGYSSAFLQCSLMICALRCNQSIKCNCGAQERKVSNCTLQHALLE